MKTQIVVTIEKGVWVDSYKYTVITEDLTSVFKTKEAASELIGMLQQEILSLRVKNKSLLVDNEELKDEIEECEDYDYDEDPWDD